MEFLYALLPTALFAIGILIFRKSLITFIEKGVAHKFEERLEKIRSELRRSEDEFRALLSAKQSEISALRDGALSGRANHQAMVDKRRLEAVERIWSQLVALAPFKALTATMAVMRFEAIAKETPRNEKLRGLFTTLLQGTTNAETLLGRGKLEQPFLSPVAWAYFSAYQHAVFFTYAQAKILETGMEDAPKFLNTQGILDLLKEVFPERASAIQQHGVALFPGFLDELEAKILDELRKTLSGEESDQTSVDRAARIIGRVRKVDEQTAKARLPDSAADGFLRE